MGLSFGFGLFAPFGPNSGFKGRQNMNRYQKEMRRRRIERDIALLERTYVVCKHENGDGVTVVIDGPADTPYQGGHFTVQIQFPDAYPFVPPRTRFVTRVYHPNVAPDGQICVDVLKDMWSPALSAPAVLLTLAQLLASPNGNDPLSEEVATLMAEDRQAFLETAKLWTARYATYQQAPDTNPSSPHPPAHPPAPPPAPAAP